ncbi:predicted protein [Postia placenta Mad-698-R]|nr:predicted protein [Postia placenta Mad-698-R]
MLRPSGGNALYPKHGWHFGAIHMNASQIEDFHMDDMAVDMRNVTPELWDLIGYLLTGEENKSESELVQMDAEEVEYWAVLEGESQMSSRHADIVHTQCLALKQTQCNALPAVNGLLLHACNTPDKVIKVLAHTGFSISPSTINQAMSSDKERTNQKAGGVQLDLTEVMLVHAQPADAALGAAESATRIRELGQSLMAMFVWDNFDLKLNTVTPTVKHSMETLLHLTSGLIFRLGHGFTKEDLRCSKELWEKSALNPNNSICNHAQHADTAPGAVDGNMEAITNLLAQKGIGDLGEEKLWNHDPHLVDVSNYVVLMHGDLSTCERVQSILKSQSIEETPWQCYQYVVFVMGLFHLKMATADAIWCIFLSPMNSRLNTTSLMAYVGVLQPKETLKIGSSPKFRVMHEVIGHAGIGLHLDAWDKKIKSLKDFVDTKPTLEVLHEMADMLASEYVSNSDSLYDACQRTSNVRDVQLENTRLLHQYLLLYEELAYTMNSGDIGCVETLFPAWIALFKATSKHKYVNQMFKFMTNLHFVYPQCLRDVIHHHMMINLKGQLMMFRAVDWVVELHNLFTKDMYGGDGSNYTKAHILTESPNILVHWNCTRNAEHHYHLNGLSTAHGKKHLTKTFATLAAHMQEHGPHEHHTGCKSEYIIEDMIDKGLTVLWVSNHKGGTVAEDGDKIVDDEASVHQTTRTLPASKEQGYSPVVLVSPELSRTVEVPTLLGLPLPSSFKGCC